MQEKVFSKPKLILFSIITVLVFLLCAELCARIVLSFQKGSPAYLLYGFKNIQEKQRLQKFAGEQEEAEYYKSTPSLDKRNPVNSMGFRGPEIKEKNPGMTRIVCLGSSTTYGEGLVFADTYPAILQEKLDERFGAGNYEVINAGQPGLNLAQIVSLTKHEVLPLYPDVVILMNINNNLKAPGFWFVDIKGREAKDHDAGKPPSFIIAIKVFIVRYVACARLIQDYAYKYDGIGRYFVSFDWKSFSAALMAPDNIWKREFEENLDQIVQVLLKHNPDMRIILIGEAVNRIKYPVMQAPFNRACEILREEAKKYKHVYTLDVETAIIEADQRGENVWQMPAYDPLHLVRRGNEIIADLLAVPLSSMFLQPDNE
jgi:lysophospholipase L1-like esterase